MVGREELGPRVHLSKAITAWIRKKSTNGCVTAYVAKDEQELSKILEYAGTSPVTVIVPAEVSEPWWVKKIGHTHPLVWFTEDRKAVVLFNTAIKHDTTITHTKDATIVIPELLKFGYTYSSLAKATGVSLPVIKRAARKKNPSVDQRLRINRTLYEMLKASEEGD